MEIHSQQASLNYWEFDDPQVSKAALPQGFGITQQQWGNLAKMVNRGLSKHGITLDHTLRSKAAEEIQKKLGLDIIKAFPGPSIQVLPQLVERGINQIIRSVHNARQTRRSDNSKSRTPRRRLQPLLCSTRRPPQLPRLSIQNQVSRAISPSRDCPLHQMPQLVISQV